MNKLEVQDFIKRVLAKRFHDNFEKQQVDDSNDRKLSFACPICGDSKKKASKKRGNFYFDTLAYKCFNDGCMAYMSLGEFVAKMSKELNLDLPNFLAEPEYSPIKIKRTENPFIRFMTSDTSKLVTISDVINRFGLIRLDCVDSSSIAFKYIDNRCLTRVLDYGDFLYTDQSDNKVFIFNFDRRSGKLLGFAIRSLDANPDGKKYIIKSYTDLAKIFSQKDLDQDLIEDANYLNNYFNVLNVNFSKPILLTEGQFDSMFLQNCIATTGVKKAHSILLNLGVKEKVRVLFDRDSAGKNELLSLIKQGYSVLLWNKLIDDLKKRYQDLASITKLSGVKDINDLFIFIKLRDASLSVLKFNEWIANYFSDSVYDIVYL